ncbi:MAG: hypothetical protein WD356_02980 [Pseudomonadales bacterium]
MLYEYVIAWLVYLIAGLGCLLVWWKITERVSTRGIRDWLRGTAMVLIFMPWYAGELSDFYAPAFMVLIMDVFFDGSGGGLGSAVAILTGMILVLVFLIVREFRRKA